MRRWNNNLLSTERPFLKEAEEEEEGSCDGCGGCAAAWMSEAGRGCPPAEKLLKLQWSAVRVTAVTVTVGYSDSFVSPRFIGTKRQAVRVTKNRLQ